MKKILLLLLSLFLGLSSQAQEDSLQANRYVMRATLYGAGFTNILDTYLSPMEYTGPEIRILRESMRKMCIRDRVNISLITFLPVCIRVFCSI